VRNEVVTFFAVTLLAAGPAVAADGTALFVEHCAKCHGEDGNAQTAVGKAMKASPVHAGAIAPEKAVEAVRSDPKHKAVSGKLSDEDLAAIAHALPAGTAP
jgi:mono/diheme cytochrome c family protein